MTREEFSKQFETFQQQSAADGRFTNVEPSHPILDDDKPSHDEKDFSFDYAVHTGWAARALARFMPDVHADFGSYIYFATLCSAFIPLIWFCDIRGAGLPLSGFHARKEDLTKINFEDNSLDSISSLHVLEHIGLGRYGDTLDAQGDRKAAAELCRVLAPGGQLILVTPMNEVPRITFNSDRYYHLAMVREMFAPLNLAEFQLIHGGRITDQLPPKGEHYTGLMVWTK